MGLWWAVAKFAVRRPRLNDVMVFVNEFLVIGVFVLTAGLIVGLPLLAAPLIATGTVVGLAAIEWRLQVLRGRQRWPDPRPISRDVPLPPSRIRHQLMMVAFVTAVFMQILPDSLEMFAFPCLALVAAFGGPPGKGAVPRIAVIASMLLLVGAGVRDLEFYQQVATLLSAFVVLLWFFRVLLPVEAKADRPDGATDTLPGSAPAPA
jgi:hypothetical protein